MVIAHILVGPDEDHLPLVLERARAWANSVFCVIDPAASKKEKAIVDQYADGYWTGPPLFLLDEAAHRQTAWNLMVIALDPSPEDWMVIIDADEVITMPHLVQKAAKDPFFDGKRVGFTIYNLWDGPQYRADGPFRVKTEWLMFQFRQGAHWSPNSTARAPDYVYNLPPVTEPLSDIAHYGYLTAEQRERKWKRDQARGKDVTALSTKPLLGTWKKGGLPKNG